MKFLKCFTIILFCIVMILPIATFNTKSDVLSEIDNRKLAENPFSATEGDFTSNVENYVNDRIGFRDEMILGYTVLNDKLFGKMAHPTYVYGQDGYIFGAGLDTETYDDYHETFADMLKKLQDYCEERKVPFLAVFNPTKSAILTEYLPKGMYYNRDWVDEFTSALEKRGVNYLDNTKTLEDKHLAGEVVFNQKYDANHWNDLGAFYGTTEIVSTLKKDMPTVHVTTKDEITVSKELQTTLPVSKFPIEEYVPSISIDMDYENLTGNYSGELELNPSYRSFGCYRNSKLQSEGAPRALVFQGSYMNNYGYKYFINAFGEYIHVHDYQNVLNFDYYFNVFKPECVIFEVAEYTLNETYFSYKGMKNMSLNKTLANNEAEVSVKENAILKKSDLTVEKGDTLTTIIWNTDKTYTSVWLKGSSEYDFKKCENGYKVTLKTEDYLKLADKFQIVALEKGNSLIYMSVSKK